MSTLERLEKPVTITLPSGDFDILAGLLQGEYNIVRYEDRKPYADTLQRIRKAIFKAQESRNAG